MVTTTCQYCGKKIISVWHNKVLHYCGRTRTMFVMTTNEPQKLAREEDLQ